MLDSLYFSNVNVVFIVKLVYCQYVFISRPGSVLSKSERFLKDSLKITV